MNGRIAVMVAAIGLVGSQSGVRAGGGARAGHGRRHHHSRRRDVLHRGQEHEGSELRQLRPRRRASTVNFNRYVGVEGEVSGALGVTQNLQLGGRDVEPEDAEPAQLQRQRRRAPRRTAARSSPYVTGGVGGLTLFDKATLGIIEHRDVPHRQRRRRRRSGSRTAAGACAATTGSSRCNRRTTRRASSDRRRDTGIASTAAC